MMLDWNDYRTQLVVGVQQVGQLSPDTVKGYIELSSAENKKNLLGPKVRELISLAVAVTLRCDGCITVHTEASGYISSDCRKLSRPEAVCAVACDRVLRFDCS
jgi:alkylhydroperoxidase family enzyme